MDETRDHPVKWNKPYLKTYPMFLSPAKSGFKIYIYMHVYNINKHMCK